MTRPEGLLEVGRVGRAHGVRGDLFVHLTTDRTERAAIGAELWIDGRWRTIERSHPSNDRWRVHFSGVDERSVAEVLTGAVMYAAPIDDPHALWVHDLVGATVVELDGTARGRCTAVVDNPAADLLELESGALVPANFVVDVDLTAEPVRVTIDPPDGLFELYDEG